MRKGFARRLAHPRWGFRSQQRAETETFCSLVAGPASRRCCWVMQATGRIAAAAIETLLPQDGNGLLRCARCRPFTRRSGLGVCLPAHTCPPGRACASAKAVAPALRGVACCFAVAEIEMPEVFATIAPGFDRLSLSRWLLADVADTNRRTKTFRKKSFAHFVFQSQKEAGLWKTKIVWFCG
jgi:hypothetical protein